MTAMQSLKKITILGPAHPYRGGIASIMEILARTSRPEGALSTTSAMVVLSLMALMVPAKALRAEEWRRVSRRRWECRISLASLS